MSDEMTAEDVRELLEAPPQEVLKQWQNVARWALYQNKQKMRWARKYLALRTQSPTLPPVANPTDVLAALVGLCSEPMECGHHLECWDKERDVCVWCEADEARAEVAQVKATLYERCLSWRHLEAHEVCEKCAGAGVYTYPTTAAWRGGAGGMAMTRAVCDQCWGSGSTIHGGADLRRVDSELTKARAEVERLQDAEAAARAAIPAEAVTQVRLDGSERSVAECIEVMAERRRWCRGEVERLRGLLQAAPRHHWTGNAWVCIHCNSVEGAPHVEHCPTREPWFTGEEVADAG